MRLKKFFRISTHFASYSGAKCNIRGLRMSWEAMFSCTVYWAMDNVDENYIISLVKAGKTNKEIASTLKSAFPFIKRGFSEHSVKRYCAERNIRRATATEVDNFVRRCVEEVSLQ